MKHLIIIPGIGDDNPAYHIGARVFALLGFAPQIHSFGWNSADPSSYNHRIELLNEVVAQLDGEVYILGVSAGGSAAVNCLAMVPNKVTKVVTLCAPLAHFSSRINPLLAASIEHTEEHLAAMNADTKCRLLSLHAIVDTLVPIRLSKPDDVQSKALPAILHPITIFLGLTLFAGVSARFFKQR
jgi:pimeloyl-ACP methyl ester carboxylesterase